MCCNKRAPYRNAGGRALFSSRKAEPVHTPGSTRVPDAGPRVRTKDPTPSWLAAVSIDKHGELVLREAVEQLFRAHSPLTHDEAYNVYAACGGHRTPARVRHVVLDYVRAGLIEPVDRDGRSNRNGKSTRWQWVGA